MSWICSFCGDKATCSQGGYYSCRADWCNTLRHWACEPINLNPPHFDASPMERAGAWLACWLWFRPLSWIVPCGWLIGPETRRTRITAYVYGGWRWAEARAAGDV